MPRTARVVDCSTAKPVANSIMLETMPIASAEKKSNEK